MINVFNFIFELLEVIVDKIDSITIVQGVSLLDFLITLILAKVVITIIMPRRNQGDI